MSAEKSWKDPDYRSSLSEEELAELPENPAGTTSLSSQQLAQISGGTSLPCIASATAVSALACKGTFGANTVGCC